MDALDQWGMPAYECALDASEMLPVAGEDGVLHCPTCGHRTDEPGIGRLGDAFDITRRQWGLRGDPHVWEALRTSLKDTPTPASEAEVRAAFAHAVQQVAHVNVAPPDEGGDEDPAFREVFAHGGMSSGMVDPGWWRDMGVPLLVERATTRRPVPVTAASPPARSSLLGTVLVWVLVLMIPVATIGGGAWLIWQRTTGERAEATVLSCDTTGAVRKYGTNIRTDCVAEWTIDGQTVVGNYDAGGGEADVGKTVDVTVRGDTAYSRSLVLPVILVALGLPFALIVGNGIRHAVRTRRSST